MLLLPLLLGYCLLISHLVGLSAWQLPRSRWRTTTTSAAHTDAPAVVTTEEEYAVVIIGAGAAGLFATGAAQLFGKRTALIETNPDAVLGGDCTNAACVPSKALRSAAAAAAAGVEATHTRSCSEATQVTSLSEVHAYVQETIQRVSQRENPQDMTARNTNLDIWMAKDCRFVDPHTVCVTTTRNATINNKETTYSEQQHILRGDTIIIAVGASPAIPPNLQTAADQAGIPTWTYRSLWKSDNRDNRTGPSSLGQSEVSSSSSFSFWDMPMNHNSNILVVGGGATACELAQSLGKILVHGNQPVVDADINVTTTTSLHMVAPEILPDEDVSLRNAALQILDTAGINYHRTRVVDILNNRSIQLEDGQTIDHVDAILMCVGRSPAENLAQLDLNKAQVAFSSVGVTVFPNSLQSVTNRRVYAVGDCCEALPLRSRTATHAAWTAFHAVRNALVPKLIWWGSNDSLHKCVPRVIYTDPELSCVGLTHGQCVELYGAQGFQCFHVPEAGTDRADMDRCNRNTDITFAELRAQRGTGRILGATFCGPAAAEMANTVGMAIVNRLTLADIARSIFSYPSHGYLLHRMALSMALSNVDGLLEVCGPLPRLLAKLVRWISLAKQTLQVLLGRLMGPKSSQKREWEAEGVRQSIYFPKATPGMTSRLISFADVKANATLFDIATTRLPAESLNMYKKWENRSVYTNNHNR